MIRRLSTVIVAALVIIVVGYAVSRRVSGTTTEERIHRILLQAEQDAERLYFNGVLSIISKNYHDDYGYDYAEIRDMLQRWVWSRQKVDLALYNVTVAVEGETARVGLQVDYRIPPDKEDTLPIFLIFQRKKKDWKIVNAKGWASVLPEYYR